MKRGRAKKSRVGRQRVLPTASPDEMRPEYDFTGGVRGKYAHLFGDGRLVRAVVLAPDVAKEFPNARAVNAALRRVMKSKTRNGSRKARPR